MRSAQAQEQRPSSSVIAATPLPFDDSKLVRDLGARLAANGPSVVLAGHYCLAEHMSELSNEGDAEQASFATGVRLVVTANKQGGDVRLVVWVNDIAIASEQRAAMKATYQLPVNYQAILRDVGLPCERVDVHFESTMRNKASVLLRKLFKKSPQLFERVNSDEQGLTRCVVDSACDIDRGPPGKTAYIVRGPAGERLVVKDGSNPKCNLILATFFKDLQKRYDMRFQVNIFNDVYSYRIDLGIHVFRKILGGETAMLNVYTDGEVLTVEGE